MKDSGLYNNYTQYPRCNLLWVIPPNVSAHPKAASPPSLLDHPLPRTLERVFTRKFRSLDGIIPSWKRESSPMVRNRYSDRTSQDRPRCRERDFSVWDQFLRVFAGLLGDAVEVMVLYVERKAYWKVMNWRGLCLFCFGLVQSRWFCLVLFRCLRGLACRQLHLHMVKQGLTGMLLNMCESRLIFFSS